MPSTDKDSTPEIPVRLWLLKLKIRLKNGEIETRRFLSKSNVIADIEASLTKLELELVEVILAIAAREYIYLDDFEIRKIPSDMRKICEQELRDFLDAKDPLPMSLVKELLGY